MSAPFAPAPLQIITADQRLAETRGIKGVLTGISGIGKTSQLWTLDAERTLFMNLEAGELAVQGWPGDEVRIRDWERARDLACWIGGPNPAMRDDQPYGQKDYERVCAAFGDASVLDRYETIFVDSISVASRICLQWCKGQPQAMSDRSGKPDLRGAYGLLGQEMIGWLTHLQHTPRKNIWLVGLLDRRLDDFGKPYFAMQVEGSKTGLELPGIVDEVVTLAEVRPKDGAPFRAFVCTTINDFGFPAKDRSGRLAMLEPAHLGRLMAKIRGPRPDQPMARLDFDLPAAAGATPTPHPDDWSMSAMANDMDFNGADSQDAAFDLIPANTLVKLRLTIRPGGAGPEGWLTQSRTSSALYLNTEAIVLEGPYARRRIYTRIGFRGKDAGGPGEDSYANRGRALIRGILESARGIKAADQSEAARVARMIRSLGELSGLDFVAKIGIEKDKDRPEDTGRNVIKAAIGPDHADYLRLMGTVPAPSARPPVSGYTGGRVLDIRMPDRPRLPAVPPRSGRAEEAGP